MEQEKRDATLDTPQIVVPNWDDKPAFSASGKEILLAAAMYIVAYIYWLNGQFAFAIFTALFIAMVEWRCWDRPRPRESWVWLGCLVVIVASEPLGRNQVWGQYFWLLAHAFAIYWTLCRAGMLAGGESSTLLPLDAFHGVVLFPFKHFFLRLRTVWYGLSHSPKSGKKQPASAIFLTAGVATAAAVLLYLALRFLSSADLGFARLTSRILEWLTPDWNDWNFVTLFVRLLGSLPVGAYVYGLIAGTWRESRVELDSRADGLRKQLATLGQLSNRLWNALLGVFIGLYVVFFLVQLPELFGAFSRTLPEGLSVAEYARQGFFSLCKVLAVNFALLWLATRTSVLQPKAAPVSRILATVLLGLSMALAITAASKLWLYIDCFGFTPKRLQSAWLILSLFTGCAGWLVSLWTEKKVFRPWLIFSAVTLALLHLY